MRFIENFRSRDTVVRLGKAAILPVVVFVIVTLVMWVHNPHQRGSTAHDQAPPVWHAPPGISGSPDPPLPSGFPSMERPPPMIDVPKGVPHVIPTRYGLTYTVPAEGAWRPSNDMVAGWTDEVTNRTIVMYGSVSDYGYGYCPETDGSALANVGVRGRNGLDVDTAAREEIGKAEQIFSDSATGRKATVTVGEPTRWQIADRTAVRYSAKISGIPRKHSCDATEAGFDIVAVPAYSSAEVAVFMIEHAIGPVRSLTDADIDATARSIKRTE
ncbi:hypothetical protein BJY24_006348 [Nocardia transvalensis]|uniref:DUF8017 domain-containing protein n=1 Tax=Nocardia transvalensis TaxID=37333 RepID=A0A7W9PJZ7_9NOCA|nr:hypothetical protein [Nocardia transvalensis]MBB5917436.1 hypothetical protein [Nocardia transvalensis]